MREKVIVHKNIRLLTWFNFCLNFNPYAPIAILYFTQVTGSFALGLSVFSIQTFASSIFEVPTGILSDYIGRKRTMICGAASITLAITSYAVGGSFAVLAVGAVLEGLSYSFFSGNNDALLYDSLKEEGQEKVYAEHAGKTHSMFQFALALSAVVASVFLGWSSFQLVYWISVIPQIIGLLIAFNMVEPHVSHQGGEMNIFHHLKEAFGQFRKNSRLRLLSVSEILGRSFGESIHQFMPAFFATLWPTWALGIARVISHLCAAISMRIAGRLIKRFGNFNVLWWGELSNFIIGLGAVGYPTIVSPAMKALTSISFGTSNVAQGALFQKEFTNEQRATMSSLNSLAGSLMFALVAFMLGKYADYVGPRWGILTAQLVSLPILYLYWKLFKKRKNQSS